MPRALSGGERALLAASNYDLHLKVEAENSSGTYIDVSTWVESVDIDASLDNGAVTGTVTLARESGQGGTASLAPFMSASLLNRNNANAYAPLLNPNRSVRISTAVTVAGVAPISIDWRVLYNGVTDVVSWGATPLTVSMRDGVKRLLDTQIEVTRTYGAPTPGIAVETVMQQIIDDNVASPPTLSLGPTGTPNWFIQEYSQETVRVYDALRALAMQIGYDVRMRWNGTTEQLTFYRPDRTKSSPDFTLGPSEYLDVTDLAINDDGVRNVVEVLYFDATTGLPDSVVVTDAASIAAFGRRYMRLAEDASSNIDTLSEATAMANAALADLASPRATHSPEATYFWPIELGDLIAFQPNGVHYDSTQQLAVSAFHHHLEHGSGTTTLTTSGQPAGAYAWWLRHATVGDTEQPPLPGGLPLLVRLDVVSSGAASMVISVTVADPEPVEDLIVGVTAADIAALHLLPNTPQLIPLASITNDLTTSGSVLYALDRPAPGTGPERVTFTVEGATRTPVLVPLDVTEAAPGTASLVLRATQTAQNTLNITVRVAVADTSPGGNISLAYIRSSNLSTVTPATPVTLSGGSITTDLATTAYQDFVIPRPSLVAGSAQIVFVATATDRVAATGAMTVPETATSTVNLETVATITGGTDTTVTVLVTATDPLGQVTPTIGAPVAQNLAGTITGSNPYTIPRNATGTARVTWTATATGRIQDSDSVDIPPLGVALTFLQCVATLQAVSASQVTVLVRVADTTPGPSITVQYVSLGIPAPLPPTPQGAAGTVTTNPQTSAFALFTFSRPPFGQGGGRVTFYATATGRVQDGDSVDIPEVGRDTIGLAIRATGLLTAPTTVTVRVAVADPIPTAGQNVALAVAALGTTVAPGTTQTLIAANLTTDLATTAYVDYVVQRPAFGVGAARITWTSTASNRVPNSATIDVPEIGRDTIGLALRVTGLTSTPTSIIARVAVADPIPGATVTLTYVVEGASIVTPTSPQTVTGITADLATTGYKDFAIARPVFGLGMTHITFTASATNRVQATGNIDVQTVDRDTVNLIVAARITGMGTTTAEVTVSVADPAPLANVSVRYISLGTGAINPPSVSSIALGSLTSDIYTTGKVVYTIGRPPIGSEPGYVSFLASASGRGQAEASLNIPAVSNASGTSCAITAATVSTAADTVTLSYTVGGSPAGGRVDLVWIDNYQHSSGAPTTISNIGTSGTYVHPSSGGHGYDFITGFGGLITLAYTLNVYNSSNALVASAQRAVDGKINVIFT